MKILLINKFFYLKGGSESVFFETAELLKNKGHKVIFFSMKHAKNIASEYEKYFVSNVDYESKRLKDMFQDSLRLLYFFEAKQKMEELIEKERPDIAHLHNIHHQISPSILHSLKKFKIPIILTLHDYKMVCPTYSLLSKGVLCESCRGGKYYQCFLKKCVKNSRMKSLLNTIEMYLHHGILRIYNLTEIFTSPSRFLISKLNEMGFKNRIDYLPNFVNFENFEPRSNWEEKSIVYFGRLSKEKGLFTLVKAIKQIPDITLKIIGEGPIEEILKAKVRAERIQNIEFLGYQNSENLKDEIRRSMFVVLPSECYENNPRSIIESFALGKPVIGSRIGGIPELIKDACTGVVFEPGDLNDLISKIEYLRDNPDKILNYGRNARTFVEKELNPERYYQKLINIYEEAFRNKS